MITDSHCHLDYPELFNELDDVINRAKSNNITKLLTICTTLKSFEKIDLISKKYNNVYATFGIHPHETKEHKEIDAKYIINIKKNNNKVIGIGETGLDFFYNHSDKKIQIKSFNEHIEASMELNIPIIVHTRNAEVDTYDLIKEAKKKSDLKVLIHCFTGSKDFAKKLIDLGCYISISGIITFKKSTELAETTLGIPLNNLLVETDSPYLAPHPFRGKSNEPSYIIHTIERLSQIKGVSKEDIITYTTKNFNKLFNLK
ncbi:TatD family hydrolase [Pelagibacteraceae bacterium]|jgi:TatD DNase family protein|nr:TatD family hydrolase [Pelagibacteraceae bacterium]